jgi:hypothetical protein
MAKYGEKASAEVAQAMHEMKRGTLKSGRSGKKVSNPKQSACRRREKKAPKCLDPRRKAAAKRTRRARRGRLRSSGVEAAGPRPWPGSPPAGVI